MLSRIFEVSFIGLILLVAAQQELWAQCDVCNSCTSGADCLGGVCVDFGTGGVCSTSCATGRCPGDTVCYTVTNDTGADELLCLNPGADAGVCPASYICGAASCNTLGIDCSDNGANCLPDAELCLSDASGSAFCSCYCTNDADCGAGNSCVDLDSGDRGCVTGAVANPCSGVTCPTGQHCSPSSGTCVVSTGGCPGLGNDCANSGQFCEPANDVCLADANGGAICSCVCTSAADCGAGARCLQLNDGSSACIPPCVGVECGETESCDPTTGTCVNLCANVTCPGGGICSPATGTCIGGNSDVGPTDTYVPQPDATSTPDVVTLDTHNTTTPDQGAGNDTRPTGLGDVSGDCGCSLSQHSSDSGLVLSLLVALGALLLGRKRRR